MKILFLYSFFSNYPSLQKPITTDHIHFGISYISSVLKQHGHETKLLVLPKRLRKKYHRVVDSCIENFAPHLICFTAVSSEYPLISGVAKYIKDRYPDIFLLIGGVHPSLNPDHVMNEIFDGLCIGEGEYPTLELVQQLEDNRTPSGIANLWIRHGSHVEKNVPREFIQNLDELPFPDREMWVEWTDYSKSKCIRYNVLLGRGCPFRCSYCSNHALRNVAPGQYVRLRSPQNIIEEIKSICVRFPQTREIYLEIETIGINKTLAIELCSQIEKMNMALAHPLTFGVNLRITPHDDLEPLFKAFQRSNISFVNIGVESGSERVRREVLRRNYSNNDIIRAVKLARKYGIKVCFYLLLGLPGETMEDYFETVNITRTCLPDWYALSIFYPYEGTDLYKFCQEKKYMKGMLETDWERQKPVLDSPGFSKKQIRNGYIWFQYRAYKGYRPTIALIGNALALATEQNIFFSFLLKMVNQAVTLTGVRQLIKKFHKKKMKKKYG